MQNEKIVITQVQIKFGWHDEETGKNEGATIWLSGEEALCWLQRHLTPRALGAAIQPPAEHVQNSDIIPAGEVDTQPRQ